LVRVQLSTPVTHVRNWNSAGPVEIAREHGTVRAKRVIMALSQSQARVIDFAPALPAERATEQKRWPAAPDMMKSAMVHGRPFQHDAGLSASVSGSTPTSTCGRGTIRPPTAALA